jgi:Cohesin domain
LGVGLWFGHIDFPKTNTQRLKTNYQQQSVHRKNQALMNILHLGKVTPCLFPRQVLSGLIVLFAVCQLQAQQQVTFVAPTLKAKNNDLVAVDVRVKSYDSIASFQLSLGWDPAILTFSRLDSFRLAGLDASLFNVNNVANGKISVVWTDITGTSRGVRPMDSVSIFKVYFRVIGVPLTSSPIRFDSVPTTIRAYNGNYTSLSLRTINGSVTVERTSPTADLVSKGVTGIKVLPIFPNPSLDSVHIPFEIEKGGEVEMTIHDASGRRIYTKSDVLTAGKYEWTAEGKWLTKSGNYLVVLNSKSGKASRWFMIGK